MDQKTIEYLKRLAERSTFNDNEDDDACVYDYCGGNVDDAFAMGERAGETEIARTVLTALGVDYDIDE